MSHIQGVIFDMDGLLIDTEPVWRRAEIEVFAGVGLRLTEDEALQTMGVRIAEIVEGHYARRPWPGPSPAEVTRQIEDHVIAHVLQEGEPKPGVHRAMQVVRQAGLPIAIASSSSERLIRAVVQRLRLGEYVEVIASGDNEAEGKPHPAVYLTTARKLGLRPESCVALEDSPNGVLSAKSAGMYCVVVPDPYLANDPRMDRADLRIDSLEAFSLNLLAELEELPAS